MNGRSCEHCDGTGWLESPGNSWITSLFVDPRRAFAYRALASSFKPCACTPNEKYESYENCNTTSEQNSYTDLKLTRDSPPHPKNYSPSRSSYNFKADRTLLHPRNPPNPETPRAHSHGNKQCFTVRKGIHES
jgi:hypothetical protein